MQDLFCRRIPIVAMAVAVTLSVAGCGGGGGGGDNSAVSTDAVLASIQAVPTVKEVPFVSPEPATCPTTSHPFSTMLCSLGPGMDYNSNGTAPVDLKRDYGYMEKEFFQSGKANVYELGTDERAVVRSAGNPYSTRLLVRYPIDAAKFSGRVYVEILNASNNFDIENTWRRSWQHIMRAGDAFIGITSKSGPADALKKFDATRYADINWKVNGVNEDGLFWDMLSQLGTELRQPGAGGILGSLQPKYVYLTGESQSGFYINTYLTAFSDKVERAGAGGAPLFDGYLNGVGPIAVPLRSEAAAPSVSVPKKIWQPTKVPHIVYMSENESRMTVLLRRADSDTATDKFRFYEYPGTPHTDSRTQTLPINAEIVKAGGSPRSAPPYYGAQEHDDLQLTEFVHAMHESIHEWASNGTAAPAAAVKWMLYDVLVGANGDAFYEPQRDQLGNALGGVRSPLIDAPLYQFYGRGQTGPNSFLTYGWGSMEKLSDTVINGLYGGKCSTYLTRFNAVADALVTARYLVKYDADIMKSWAITKGNTVVWTDGKTCN